MHSRVYTKYAMNIDPVKLVDGFLIIKKDVTVKDNKDEAQALVSFSLALFISSIQECCLNYDEENYLFLWKGEAKRFILESGGTWTKWMEAAVIEACWRYRKGVKAFLKSLTPEQKEQRDYTKWREAQLLIEREERAERLRKREEERMTCLFSPIEIQGGSLSKDDFVSTYTGVAHAEEIEVVQEEFAL